MAVLEWNGSGKKGEAEWMREGNTVKRVAQARFTPSRFPPFHIITFKIRLSLK